jgi:hypothetical protein
MGRMTRFIQASAASAQQTAELPRPKPEINKARTDNDLQRVIKCWPSLSKQVRGAILDLIENNDR